MVHITAVCCVHCRVPLRKQLVWWWVVVVGVQSKDHNSWEEQSRACQLFCDCELWLPMFAMWEVCDEAKWTAVEFWNNLVHSVKLFGDSGNKTLKFYILHSAWFQPESNRKSVIMRIAASLVLLGRVIYYCSNDLSPIQNMYSSRNCHFLNLFLHWILLIKIILTQGSEILEIFEIFHIILEISL